LLSNVPTVAESGPPGYEGVLWIGMLAPAATPQPIVERIASAAARAVRSPELLERLRRDGVDLVGNRPEAFRALIAREIPQWREVGQAAKITLE
jgi:tripartite-type tricarboxylate transporter receptor subunit TctC